MHRVLCIIMQKNEVLIFCVIYGRILRKKFFGEFLMIALSTQDICLSFGTDVILKDVSFAINDGDRVGIIGVNGAGKTSLFRVITGE